MNPEDWQRVKKVLEDALEREPSERAAYLEEACPDPSFRREVESLIAAHDEAPENYLTGPGIQANEAAAIGDRLGSYVIRARIGAGGMGVVYCATDIKLGRRVALKVLPPEMAHDPARLARFQREARSVAALNHPNIVTLYSIEEEDGVHFLVMELVEGMPLNQIAVEYGLTLDENLRIAAAIAEALAAAHERGIIHRDLKPSNVMLTNDGRVKVLDFGLAKQIQPADSSITHSTREGFTGEGTLLGTPAYMSPEQTRGESVTTASDIFSLGIVYYEMATGQHPFYSDSTAGYLRSIASRHPIPPSRLKPEIPAWFEALLVRMLQKRPDKRCAATEIVAAFRDQGESLDPRGLSLANSMPGGPESNHKELDLLSALESTLIDRKRLASDEFLDMHRPVQVPPKKEGDPSTTFLAQAGMFWRAIASSDFANARGHAELCLRSAEEKGDSGLIMQAHYMFAQVFFHLGEHFECDRRIRKAISLYDPARHAKLVETSGIDVRANGTALLGLNLWYLGFSDQSRTKVRESIEIARTAPHPAPLAFALIMQTFLHDFLGDPQIMQDGSREVTAIAVEHNLQADTWFWGKFGTGWALAKLGKTEEGWAEMRSAMADADQIGMAYAMPTFGWALACSLAQNGWAEDARALIDRYLPHVEQSGPREKLSELYRLKGELLLGRNLESDAKRLFESALDAARKSGALAHELRAAVSLARLYLKMGQPAAGRRILPPVFDLFTEGFETPDLREARVLIQELSEETTSGPMCA